MVRIESGFLKRLQPYLCPEGASQANAPWCSYNPEPVDLDSYKKAYTARSYFPFKPPVAVRFCAAFKAISTEGVCHTVDSGVQEEISAMINAPKTDGVWPPLPTETQIYRKLSRATPISPPGLSARLEQQIRARAKRIRDGIIEARSLDDKGKKEEAQKKREKLDEELIRVCTTEDTYATLTRVSDDCNLVLERHLKIKTAWIDGKKWLAAKVGAALLALWGLAKTGVLKKMRASFGEKWRTTKPQATGGAVRKFIRNVVALPGRFLKSAWAAIRVKEASASVQPPPAAVSLPVPTAAPAPAPEPSNPATAETVEKMAGRVASVQRLARIFERRFFSETVPDALHSFARAARLLRGGHADEAGQVLAGNDLGLIASGILRNQLDADRSSAAVALEDIPHAGSDSFITDLREELARIDRLAHDTGAILDTLFNIQNAANVRQMEEALVESGLYISTVGGLLTAARWLNSHEARRRGSIKLHVVGKTNLTIAVPSGFQKDILRLLYMAGNNSVRHSNPEFKADKSVVFKADMHEETSLTLSIWDNGVGMAEEKKREVLSRSGRGFGISEMRQICDEHGWQFDLSSQRDKGTVVKVTIDVSGWQKGATTSVAGGETPPPAMLPPATGSQMGAATLAGMAVATASTFALSASTMIAGMPMMF